MEVWKEMAKLPNRNAVKKWSKYKLYEEILNKTKTLNTYDLSNDEDLDNYIREQENFLVGLKTIKETFRDEYEKRLYKATREREKTAHDAIAKTIKQVLSEKRMTQSKLAELLCVSPTVVSQMCDGSYCMSLPPLKHILAVCHVLNITPNELLGFEQGKVPE